MSPSASGWAHNLRWARKFPPRLALWTAILAWAALALVLDLPGHLSDDSVVQLAQGRSGSYDRWHPPVMAWILGVFDRLWRGTGLFVAFDVGLIASAWALLAATPRRASWLAIPALALIAATPQLVVYPGDVWKDVLVAAATLLGFASLARAARSGTGRGMRRGLGLASVAAIAIAGLARQNGLVMAPFAAAAAGVVATRRRADLSWRAGVLAAGAYLAAVLAVVAGATLALDARSDAQPSARLQWEELETWDIAGALARDPRLPLSDLDAGAPALARALRGPGVAAYTPARVDPVRDIVAIRQSRLADLPIVADEWRALWLTRPALMARVRASAFVWVLFTPDIEACLPVYVGVDGPPALMARLGLKGRWDDRDQALDDWAERFTTTPVFEHGAFAAAALMMMVLLVRRSGPSDLVIAAMLASALAFTASFLPIAVACDYRYLYWLDLATLTGVLWFAVSRSPKSPASR